MKRCLSVPSHYQNWLQIIDIHPRAISQNISKIRWQLLASPVLLGSQWVNPCLPSPMHDSYNNCNPGGPVGLPQGCKPIHWNPNTFLEKKVCWQIAQKLQKTSMANFTYLFWTLYFASRTKNKLKQLYFNGAVSIFFQQSLHLPKNKQPKWRLLWSHDPWDHISWFPLPSLGPSPMENPMLKG